MKPTCPFGHDTTAPDSRYPQGQCKVCAKNRALDRYHRLRKSGRWKHQRRKQKSERIFLGIARLAASLPS